MQQQMQHVMLHHAGGGYYNPLPFNAHNAPVAAPQLPQPQQLIAPAQGVATAPLNPEEES